jgi:putative transposase
LRPGDIVIMDNLGSHMSSAIRRVLRAAGAKLFFLPKYSPDLNPIEMLFSKLKHGLRKAAKRTQDAIYHAIVDLLPDVDPNQCANYFAKAGYARSSSHPALALPHGWTLAASRLHLPRALQDLRADVAAPRYPATLCPTDARRAA